MYVCRCICLRYCSYLTLKYKITGLQKPKDQLKLVYILWKFTCWDDRNFDEFERNI